MLNLMLIGYAIPISKIPERRKKKDTDEVVYEVITPEEKSKLINDAIRGRKLSVLAIAFTISDVIALIIMM